MNQLSFEYVAEIANLQLKFTNQMWAAMVWCCLHSRTFYEFAMRIVIIINFILVAGKTQFANAHQ